jgi:hypothetical protein
MKTIAKFNSKSLEEIFEKGQPEEFFKDYSVINNRSGLELHGYVKDILIEKIKIEEKTNSKKEIVTKVKELIEAKEEQLISIIQDKAVEQDKKFDVEKEYLS